MSCAGDCAKRGPYAAEDASSWSNATAWRVYAVLVHKRVRTHQPHGDNECLGVWIHTQATQTTTTPKNDKHTNERQAHQRTTSTPTNDKHTNERQAHQRTTSTPTNDKHTNERQATTRAKPSYGAAPRTLWVRPVWCLEQLCPAPTPPPSSWQLASASTPATPGSEHATQTHAPQHGWLGETPAQHPRLVTPSQTGAVPGSEGWRGRESPGAPAQRQTRGRCATPRPTRDPGTCDGAPLLQQGQLQRRHLLWLTAWAATP